MTKVFIPASIGNVGPGFDVLGLSLSSIGDTVTVQLIDGPSEIASITGVDADDIPKDPLKNCATIAADAFLRSQNSAKGVSLSIDRTLPLAGGMGGSATASVGGAFAAAAALGKTGDTKNILLSALAGESEVAGAHLDNIAPSLFGGLCLVQSVSPPIVKRIPIIGGLVGIPSYSKH